MHPPIPPPLATTNILRPTCSKGAAESRSAFQYPAPSLRGFTLTELAIVLFIVALMIGGMLMPLSAQMDIRARSETEKTLNEIRDALIGFAVINKRLPRPATSATNGTENPATCANDAACSGFIPWATLGTPKTDGWGKLVRYSVTPAYANADITLASAGNRKVTIGVGLADLANAVPAVVFSHGKNHFGTTDAGAALGNTSSTNADEVANDAGPLAYVSRAPTESTTATGGEFDDIVIWLSTNILINRLVSAGKL